VTAPAVRSGARKVKIEYASCLAYQEAFRLGTKLAKPNYQFAKRQRDLAKKQKKEQKRLKKAAPGEPGGPDAVAADPAEHALPVASEIKVP
jgi:hypothetical protein